jgi:hypothetical protein
MRTTTKRKIALSLMFLSVSSAFAQTHYHGDSVMPNPFFNPNQPRVIKQGAVNQAPPLTYQFMTDSQLSNCPAGFRGQYGTQYASAERTITIINRESTVVGKEYGPWQATDEECAKTETQNVSCPAYQTGYISQSRTVTSSGTVSDWTTTANTCAPMPVVCSASSWGNTYACPSGYTGNVTSTSYNVCPSGPYAAGYQYEGPRTNNCVAIPVAPPPPVATPSCPQAHYECAPWKPGMTKIYIVQYGPAPSCTVQRTYFGLSDDSGNMCGDAYGG